MNPTHPYMQQYICNHDHVYIYYPFFQIMKTNPRFIILTQSIPFSMPSGEPKVEKNVCPNAIHNKTRGIKLTIAPDLLWLSFSQKDPKIFKILSIALYNSRDEAEELQLQGTHIADSDCHYY